MAIKDDVKAIKEQIGAEEQFLESIIKGERFFKKYKYPIIGLVIALIVFGVGYSLNEYLNTKRLNKTNEAFTLLQTNPNNQEALKALKDGNPKLYEAFLFQKASRAQNVEELKNIVSTSSDPIIKSIAIYELDSGESEILKDLQVLLDGYNLLKENKIEQARNRFLQIQPSSPLQEIIKKLNHYQGIK